jgi:dTDP-4-dehydrorhamnose reductase
MRVLILGGSGMLGHKVWQVLKNRFEVHVATRGGWTRWGQAGPFEPDRFHGGLEAGNLDTLPQILVAARPEVIINCVGIVKQAAAAADPMANLTVNALFPHRVAAACQMTGSRLIQISTDCVFSGRKGGYSEADTPDAEDLYGRTKLLGEVTGPRCLTLRTSIIGRELCRQSGLVEWFRANRGKRVRGYTQAIFSGFTTQAMGEILARIIGEFPALSGLYHVASEPISKHLLLMKIAKALDLDITVEPYADYHCDRSLNASRFQAEACWRPPSWDSMIEELAADPTPYDQWRTANVA